MQQTKVINHVCYTDASFSCLVDGLRICCCWSWIWSSAWPCAWGWPSSLDGCSSCRYPECVCGGICFSSSFLFFSCSPTLFSLASAWITDCRQRGHQSASLAPYRSLHYILQTIALHLQIGLTRALPLFLSSVTYLLFPHTIKGNLYTIIHMLNEANWSVAECYVYILKLVQNCSFSSIKNRKEVWIPKPSNKYKDKEEEHLI